MKIKDPQKKACKPLNDGMLTFPFFTIENVDVCRKISWACGIAIGASRRLSHGVSNEMTHGILRGGIVTLE